MAETWYPKAKRLPITTEEFTKNRGMPILAIVDHITAGSDSRDWLQHKDNKSSVMFLIRVEGGRGVTYQFMPLEWAAWGNGRHSGVDNPFMEEWVREYIRRGINPNLFTVNIEHEGVKPTAALYTGPMLEESIALHKWLVETVPTIKPDRAHIIGHYQIDHIDRPFCPGGPGGKHFPFDMIIAAVKGSSTPPPPTAPQTKPAPLITPYTVPDGSPLAFRVGGAIRDYWEAHGGVGVFGWPMEDERGYDSGKARILEDGRPWTTQTFEYERLAWRPDKGVIKVRLGAEALKQEAA